MEPNRVQSVAVPLVTLQLLPLWLQGEPESILCIVSILQSLRMEISAMLYLHTYNQCIKTLWQLARIVSINNNLKAGLSNVKQTLCVYMQITIRAARQREEEKTSTSVAWTQRELEWR